MLKEDQTRDGMRGEKAVGDRGGITLELEPGAIQARSFTRVILQNLFQQSVWNRKGLFFAGVCFEYDNG